jgi:hypothetical protein
LWKLMRLEMILSLVYQSESIILAGLVRGVERGSSRSFLILVPNRTAPTLLPIIQQYILPGSTVMSTTFGPKSKLFTYVNTERESLFLFQRPTLGPHF